MKTNEVQLTYANGNKTELFYSPYADPRVAGIIEQHRFSRSRSQNNARFRFFYGDTDRPDFEAVHDRKPDPGHDWGEENDVTGTIGNSTGPIKIPLLLANRRSDGGGGYLN